MTTTPHPTDALPLPEPDDFRTRYRSEPGMIGHYPWTYVDERRRFAVRPEHEYEFIYNEDKVRAAHREGYELAMSKMAGLIDAALLDRLRKELPTVQERETVLCSIRGDDLRAVVQALAAPAQQQPIDMVLYCPNCGTQHIDEAEEDRTEQICEGPDVVDEVIVGWDNPPHRSHLCHGCGCIWRPADVATNGVEAIKTEGKRDTWPAMHNNEIQAAQAQQQAGAAEVSDEQIVTVLESAGVEFQRFMGGLGGAQDIWTTAGSQRVKKIAAGVRAILALKAGGANK